LAAPHRFADFASGHGIPFAPLPGDPEELSRRLNDSGTRAFGMVKSMADYTLSIAGGVIRAAFAACEDADLVVHTFLITAGATPSMPASHAPSLRRSHDEGSSVGSISK
jgi:hypothetical protein